MAWEYYGLGIQCTRERAFLYTVQEPDAPRQCEHMAAIVNLAHSRYASQYKKSDWNLSTQSTIICCYVQLITRIINEDVSSESTYTLLEQQPVAADADVGRRPRTVLHAHLPLVRPVSDYDTMPPASFAIDTIFSCRVCLAAPRSRRGARTSFLYRSFVPHIYPPPRNADPQSLLLPKHSY